jgi:hypothetical protein
MLKIKGFLRTPYERVMFFRNERVNFFKVFIYRLPSSGNELLQRRLRLNLVKKKDTLCL